MSPICAERPRHLCNTCVHARFGAPVPCAVNAPAAAIAVRSGLVTACPHYLAPDGVQAVAEGARPRSR